MSVCRYELGWGAISTLSQFQPSAELKLDLTKTMINPVHDNSVLVSWISVISEKNMMKGLVGGPLLVGGLGHGPLDPIKSGHVTQTSTGSTYCLPTTSDVFRIL